MATATSNGPPPVVTLTPTSCAVAIFAIVAASSATIQHAIDNLRMEIKWAL
jgi:hypothetical protein